jgi:hypothetical protein
MWMTGVEEHNFTDFEKYSVVCDIEVSDIASV